MKHLAQTMKALADPIRLRIVLLLQAEGELCVCDLMAVLKLPHQTAAVHRIAPPGLPQAQLLG